MSTARGALVAVGAVALVVVLAVVGWQAGWWLKAKTVNREVGIVNRNTGVQTAWHDRAVTLIGEYELADPANTAARGALRTQACQLIGRLSSPYRDDLIVRFDEENCR